MLYSSFRATTPQLYYDIDYASQLPESLSLVFIYIISSGCMSKANNSKRSYFLILNVKNLLIHKNPSYNNTESSLSFIQLKLSFRIMSSFVHNLFMYDF